MDLKHADKLSQPVMALLATAPAAYAELVPRGRGAKELRAQLQQLSADDLVTAPVTAREEAEALRAGLWLRHDFLDESHTISQALQTPSGSFWHAIMHRREGDFSNAKYWYARCREHPALSDIGARVDAQADRIGSDGDAALKRILENGWDPNVFVDLVSRVEGVKGSPLYATAVRLQKIEWAALCDYCIVAASGR